MRSAGRPRTVSPSAKAHASPGVSTTRGNGTPAAAPSTVSATATRATRSRARVGGGRGTVTSRAPGSPPPSDGVACRRPPARRARPSTSAATGATTRRTAARPRCPQPSRPVSSGTTSSGPPAMSSPLPEATNPHTQASSSAAPGAVSRSRTRCLMRRQRGRLRGSPVGAGRSTRAPNNQTRTGPRLPAARASATPASTAPASTTSAAGAGDQPAQSGLRGPGRGLGRRGLRQHAREQPHQPAPGQRSRPTHVYPHRPHHHAAAPTNRSARSPPEPRCLYCPLAPAGGSPSVREHPESSPSSAYGAVLEWPWGL